MNLGENIYLMRTKKRLSQGDLADALDVSRQSVSKWENNTAVPELEKLIKMAQIFDITIDELVTGEKSAEPDAAIPEKVESTEPQIIYIEKPAPSLSVAQILGIILLAISVFVFVMLACFESHQDFEEYAPLFLPIVICGIVCIVAKRPLIWCCWLGSFSYWYYLFFLSSRWENETFLLILGIVIVCAVLYYTYLQHKRRNIHLEPWVWAMIALLVLGAAFMLAINVIPPPVGSVTAPSQVIPVYPER